MRAPASAAAIVLGVKLLTLGIGMTEAEERIRLTGPVQWIGGSRMQVMADGLGSVSVDLRDADQSAYQALRPGEYVIVDGVVAYDRSRVIARDIWRDGSRGEFQSP